jgi:TP901 family phage tail tape measure protein
VSLSGAIQAAKAFVELGLKDSAFLRGLSVAQRRLDSFAGHVRRVSGAMAGISLAVGAPAAMGAKQYADFEQAIADLRAVANPTADELLRINEAALKLSKETGQGPTEIVAAFTELLRAGRSVKDVLGGAGEAAVRFARVGALPGAQAAIVLSDAMNIFRAESLSASRAADILSAAADASSTSIEGIVEAFSNSATDFRRGNQTFTDLAAAIAMMANEGQKGGDAGTRLRVFIDRLMAPTDDARKLMTSLGLSVRNAAGEMLPLGQIIDRVNKAIEGMNPEQVDQVFEKLFGERASQGANVMLMLGSKGLEEMKAKMGGSLTVASKYEQVMSTLTGSVKSLWSSVERLAISFGETLGPPIARAVDMVTQMTNALGVYISASPKAAVAIAAIVAGIIGLTAAMVVAIPVMSMLSMILMAVSTPIGAALAGFAAFSALAVTTAAVIAGTWMTMSESGRAFAAEMKSIFGDVVAALAAGKIDEAFDLVALKVELALKRMRLAAAKKMIALRGLLGLANADDFGNIAAQMVDIAKTQGRISAIQKSIRAASDKPSAIVGGTVESDLKSKTHLEARYQHLLRGAGGISEGSAGTFNPYAASVLGRGGNAVNQLVRIGERQVEALAGIGRDISAIRNGHLAIQAA